MKFDLKLKEVSPPHKRCPKAENFDFKKLDRGRVQ